MNTKTITITIVVIAVAILGLLAAMQKAPSGTTNTATTTASDSGASQGKLNIQVICEGALAYMTFPDSAAAEKFVAECKEGKHPEVIEKYKADMNLGAGATI